VTQHFDLIVLGAGNATSVAIRAATEGWNVALVEGDLLGGACPNRGCIPSKLLLGFAAVATTIRHAGRFHIQASLDGLDIESMRQETQEATIKATDAKIESKLPDNCKLFRDFGSFVGPRQVEVNGDVLTADKILVGTGSRPSVLKAFADAGFWTSDDVFEMETVPKSITIVGGGYIACELAWFFASVGVETTMLVRRDELLRAEDQGIRALFKDGFCEEVNVMFNTTIDSANVDDNGFELELRTKTDDDDVTGKHHSERVLMAVGRDSNADKLNCEAAGIKTDGKQFIVTDEYQKTSSDGVYALGDVTGRYFFTHAAAWEATYLCDSWFGNVTSPIDYGPMPHAVFSYPEVAGVGKTEDELQAAGDEYLTKSLPYTSAAKGRAIKEQYGLCKFLVAKDGEILGCHIVGHQASVLLHEVIPVMRWRNNIESLTNMIHIHPSLSEVIRNAARATKQLVDA